MIVASFYAPRHEKWPGCDYDALLRLLDASCRRFGLDHWVISDQPRPGLQTFQCKMPENLMQAILDGQRQFLSHASGPVLLVGADCLITRDPRPLDLADITVTIGPFADCEMNTGAIWCRSGAATHHVWQAALDTNPTEWGEDQTSLHAAIQASGLIVMKVRCEDHNWAPEAIEDPAGMPTVAHFRGQRKAWMAEWARRHLSLA